MQDLYDIYDNYFKIQISKDTMFCTYKYDNKLSKYSYYPKVITYTQFL